MKKTVTVIRNGEVKMTLPNAIICSNGTILADGKLPLCDGESSGMKREGKDKIAALLKSGKASEIPLDCLAKFGQNESGLLVVDAAEYYASKRAAVKAALTPAQKDRAEIADLYRRADRIAAGNSEDNVSLPVSIRMKADSKLAAWAEKYPADAAAEKAESLRAKAAHTRSLAVGALTYDADGWLSSDEQQRRHDELIAEAVELEKQAAAL